MTVLQKAALAAVSWFENPRKFGPPPVPTPAPRPLPNPLRGAGAGVASVRSSVPAPVVPRPVAVAAALAAPPVALGVRWNDARPAQAHLTRGIALLDVPLERTASPESLDMHHAEEAFSRARTLHGDETEVRRATALCRRRRGRTPGSDVLEFGGNRVDFAPTPASGPPRVIIRNVPSRGVNSSTFLSLIHL